MAIHFNSQRERLAFLRGEYEEIIPQKATETPKVTEKAEKTAENEKKSRNKAEKPKKPRKKKEKKDEVQAE